jgi:hypothetical protein
LVLRLAGLLWRLRRATTIEAGLFEIQVEHDGDDTKDGRLDPMLRDIVYAHLGQQSVQPDHDAPTLSATGELETAAPGKTRIAVRPVNPSVDLAGSFLRLANLSNCALDREHLGNTSASRKRAEGRSKPACLLFPQAHTGPAAVLVDELDAGRLKCLP